MSQKLMTLAHIEKARNTLASRRLKVQGLRNQLSDSELGNSIANISPESIYDTVDIGFEPFLRNPIAPPNVGMVPVSEMVKDVTISAQTHFTPGSVPKKVVWSAYEEDEGMEDDNGELNYSEFSALESSFPINHKGHKVKSSMKSELAGGDMPTLYRERERILGWQRKLPQRIQRKILSEFWKRMNLGDTDTYGRAYDDQLFFSATHTGADEDKNPLTNQANLYTGAGADLTETNLLTIIESVEQYTDHYGTIFNQISETPSQIPTDNRNTVNRVPLHYHLFVGGANRKAAHDLCKLYTDNPGVFAGSVSFEVIPQIKKAETHWFLNVRLGDPDAKPINLWNKAPRVVLGQADYQHDFRYWIVRTAIGLGYRNWHTMILCRP